MEFLPKALFLTFFKNKFPVSMEIIFRLILSGAGAGLGAALAWFPSCLPLESPGSSLSKRLLDPSVLGTGPVRVMANVLVLNFQSLDIICIGISNLF